MKKVTISLWADEELIKRLMANVQLSGLRAKALNDKIQPIDQVALLVMAEMRGAVESDLEECIADQNRANIGVVLDGRSVEEL